MGEGYDRIQRIAKEYVEKHKNDNPKTKKEKGKGKRKSRVGKNIDRILSKMASHKFKDRKLMKDSRIVVNIPKLKKENPWKHGSHFFNEEWNKTINETINETTPPKSKERLFWEF